MIFRIRTILVATDLSPRGVEVIRGAGALAELAEAELHVVHAVDPESVRGDGGTREEALALANAALKEQLRAALPVRLDASTARVVPGEPHEVILHRARELFADLIVVGPHRERARARAELGTTADRLIRSSDAPCLILHAPLSLPLRHLLVSSDLSAAARGAIDLAFVWAGALRLPTSSGERTRFEVMHVVPPYAGGTSAAQKRAGEEAELRSQLDDAESSSRVAGLLESKASVVEGEEVADEILRRAEAQRADLLVMGTHGETARRRALIGSVSSVVAQRAPCPVLLVPPDFWQEFVARAGVSGAV